MDEKNFSYANLSKILIKEGEFELRQFILSSLPTTEDDVEEFQKLIKKIDRFIAGHTERYKKTCKYNSVLFTKKYADWLDKQFIDVINDSNDYENISLKIPEPKITESTGLKSYSESSEKIKRKMCVTLRDQADPAAIERVHIDNLRSNDKKLDASIVSKLGEADPLMKKRILQILSNGEREMVNYSPDEALALMIDIRQSREDYHEMHMGGKIRGANIYPSYHQILEAKKRCYPSSITITGLGVEIDLQSLMDHTSSRIMQICDVDILLNQSEQRFTLVAKWGMDGASGQSIYKQSFEGNDSTDDSSIFMTSMVPLQLKSSTEVIWLNQRPSSPKCCRPISFEFTKENEVTTVRQHQKIQSQIDRLVPFKTFININILIKLCSGRNVDCDAFKKYAFETAELFVSLYEWFYMPVSVHKVLIHGADVIRTLDLPIGMYSEEAQEARNKEFKWFREHNTRKKNRMATNEDLVHALLVSSDPVISNLRREKTKIHKELDAEVVQLLSNEQFYSKP